MCLQLSARVKECEDRLTEVRNEYLLALAAVNAHRQHYYTNDLPLIMEVRHIKSPGGFLILSFRKYFVYFFRYIILWEYYTSDMMYMPHTTQISTNQYNQFTNQSIYIYINCKLISVIVPITVALRSTPRWQPGNSYYKLSRYLCTIHT